MAIGALRFEKTGRNECWYILDQFSVGTQMSPNETGGLSTNNLVDDGFTNRSASIDADGVIKALVGLLEPP